MSIELTQSTANEPLVFLMVDSTTHITGKTGLSPTVTISKNGGAFATPSGAVTEIANGWYKVAANATDTDTLGPLVIHAEGSGADPVDDRYQVVAQNRRTASMGLSLAKTTNITGFNDIAATDVVSSGAVTTNAGAVTVGTNSDKTGYKLASDGLDSVTVETGLNARQAMSIIAAALGGILSGAGTTAITIKAAQEGSTTRISATVDASGNRSAVTLTLPS